MYFIMWTSLSSLQLVKAHVNSYLPDYPVFYLVKYILVKLCETSVNTAI